jgi:Protein of unknown function (DUF1592)/Protein of unknown function (DUF1588)/Protein of unknown function (DUF1595)/Protein of unknown function (DUF1587)/Protein of unknown function (DUF1585)
MFRGLIKICLVGAPIVAMACTGEIGAGSAAGDGPGGGTRGAGEAGTNTGSGNGSGSGTGTTGTPMTPAAPPDDKSALDPPMTISGGGKCVSNKPGPRLLRRLTAEQLDNSVRDLFKNATSPRSDVFNDPQVLGFTGDAASLLVRDLSSQQLMTYAEEVARWAVTTVGPSLSPCNQMTADCRSQFIKQFGYRAFRQPPSDETVARYEKLFASSPTFEQGLEVTIATMLQSPFFLYRSEMGEPDPKNAGLVRLTPYEVATNIAYLITRSTPDDQLLEAAKNNQLGTTEQIDAHVERLLQDPKNRQTINTFMSEWLETKRVESVLKDAKVFDFPDSLRADMERETAAFIEDVVFTKKGTIADLFNTDYTFVNAALAKHYGIAGVTSTELVKTPLPHDTGILAQGSLMAGHAGMTFSSPTLRGKLIRTRFLCEDLPPPPANVNTNIVPPKEAKTTREIFQSHVDNPACGGCHRMMDPIGFGLENYDVGGRYRTMENGLPVDATGMIHGSEVSFKGMGELNKYLSTNDNVRQCMVRFMSYFAYGATGWADDGCTLDAINAEAQKSNWSIRSVLTAITHAPHFTTRVQ